MQLTNIQQVSWELTKDDRHAQNKTKYLDFIELMIIESQVFQ